MKHVGVAVAAVAAVAVAVVVVVVAAAVAAVARVVPFGLFGVRLPIGSSANCERR